MVELYIGMQMELLSIITNSMETKLITVQVYF